ncbi:uncharacterized protein LOC115797531 [Archocentrus centrarchus]|uniref:uncharacterized protein LOC115797531 n=1 Tax=Archocentrus centrarchus TaxID=63155 RepID=UPI0011EA02E1|nr:uncharacterized protein LOC115797531 [Archocentrus centrarchus]
MERKRSKPSGAQFRKKRKEEEEKQAKIKAQFDRQDKETDVPLPTAMVGGRHFYRSHFFTCSIALLLWMCLHYVEASSGKRVTHKEVGDTVELSSGLPTEGVTMATWKYGEIKVADKDIGVSKSSRFKDRSELNSEDFTLTVRKLTLQDSGDFIFLSSINDTQRPSVTITLQVHETITKKPVIKISYTWIPSNESCKVLLECRATGNVTYNWTVGNQTLTGSKQQYISREQEGEITFTCTVSNYVSEKSAFETVKCSNSRQQEQRSSSAVIIIVRLLIGVLITLLLLYFLLRYTKSKDLCCSRLVNLTNSS